MNYLDLLRFHAFLGLLALRFFFLHMNDKQSIRALIAFIAGSFLGFSMAFLSIKIMRILAAEHLLVFLGVLSILSWGKIGTMALVLAVPLVDALYIIIRRISSGKSPLKAMPVIFIIGSLAAGWGKGVFQYFILLFLPCLEFVRYFLNLLKSSLHFNCWYFYLLYLL